MRCAGTLWMKAGGWRVARPRFLERRVVDVVWWHAQGGEEGAFQQRDVNERSYGRAAKPRSGIGDGSEAQGERKRQWRRQ